LSFALPEVHIEELHLDASDCAIDDIIHSNHRGALRNPAQR